MLTQHIIHTAVEAALAEDAPYGDITCETTIPAGETGSAHLTARENGVMSGIEVFALRSPRRTQPSLSPLPSRTANDSKPAKCSPP